ncbi:PLP-dependent aminotransferase family protein [Bacillaceae bacterium W0354]
MEMLLVKINKKSAVPLYEQIYQQIKEDIIDGKLAVGTKLPSKRKLEEFLNVSQTTIELAYGQLLAEGFISAMPRKGYFVQEIEELSYVQKDEAPPMESTFPKEDYDIDFSPGKIDPDAFPFAQWRKYARDLIEPANKHILMLGHQHGDIELRQEIARYLYHSRGVECSPEQIIVGSGTEQLLPLLIRILGEDTVYAIEDPGYPLTHHIFPLNHRKAISIPVDEEGMNVEVLQKTEATVAYVTPSHQFPTGTVLTASRRTALLNWAASSKDHYIIEDDYDSEFRYTGRPIPSLQGMDQAKKVIYLSTFSKSLMPSLRIAYMVLPTIILEKYRQVFTYYASTVPRFDQQILARFMADGHFSRHLNRMRNLYKRKLQLLTETLQDYAPIVTFSGDEAGMHIMIRVHVEQDEETLIEMAKKKRILINGLNEYRLNSIENTPSFLIGFGGIPEERISESIHALMGAWNITR